MDTILIPLINIFITILNVLYWVIFIDIILSWLVNFNVISPYRMNPNLSSIYQAIRLFSAGIYYRVNKFIPTRFNGIDFTPLAALLIIWFFKQVLTNVLIKYFNVFI